MHVFTAFLRGATFVTLAALSSVRPAAAQTTPPSWRWANAITCPTNFFLASMATDAAGNTYVAGQLRTPVTAALGTVLTAQAGDDSFVAKYSSTGSLLWTRQLTGSGNERIVRLVTDAAGNVYLAGTYNGGNMQMGPLSLPTTPYTSVYMASLDSQGQPRWLREVSNDGANASSLGLDAAGNLYLCGSFHFSATVGGIPLNAPGTISLYLAKFNAQGVAQWAQAGGSIPFAGTSVTLREHTLTISPAGDVYLTWTINPNAGGFGTVPPAPGYGDFDVSVVRFNTQGVAQWQKRYGTAYPDDAASPALDGNGSLLVPITFSASGPATVGAQTLTGTGQSYGALLQLDAGTGALQWVQKLDASGKVLLQAVATDAAGNSYVAGSLAGTTQAGGQPLSSNGTASDALVASYSDAGALRWVQKSGGPQAEAASFIALTAGNELAIGGFFSGQAQFGSTALSGGASAVVNAFVARLNPVVVTASQTARAIGLDFYPNPATNLVSVPSLPAGTRVQLLDALGRMARETHVSAATKISVQGLAPGLYTLRATNARGQQFSARLAVE